MLLTRPTIISPARPVVPPTRPRGRLPVRWSPRPWWRREIDARAAHGLQFGSDGKPRFVAGKALFAAPGTACCCDPCPDFTAGPTPPIIRATFAGTATCGCRDFFTGGGDHFFYQESAGEFNGVYDLRRITEADIWYSDLRGPGFPYGCAWGLRADVGLRVDFRQDACPPPASAGQATTLDIYLETRGFFAAELRQPATDPSDFGPRMYFLPSATGGVLVAGWQNNPFPQTFPNQLICGGVAIQAARAGGTAVLEEIF